LFFTAKDVKNAQRTAECLSATCCLLLTAYCLLPTSHIFSIFNTHHKNQRFMIAVFVAYLIVLIGIVAYSARRSKTNDDYVLGGKKISGI